MTLSPTAKLDLFLSPYEQELSATRSTIFLMKHLPEDASISETLSMKNRLRHLQAPGK